MSTDIFGATNSLKILSFLAENAGREFLGSGIQKATKLSRAGIYIALRELTKKKLVSRTRTGKFLVYTVVYDDPVIKQFKVLRNVLLLGPVIAKLKPLAKKIILYGSASRGEDLPSSDIDLFVLSKDAGAAKDMLSAIRIKRKIQAVVKSPSESADLKDKERVFYGEVDRGIVLWQDRQ